MGGALSCGKYHLIIAVFNMMKMHNVPCMTCMLHLFPETAKYSCAGGKDRWPQFLTFIIP